MKDYFYLAHPLHSRKEVREWELGFEKRTGLNLANPFYDIFQEGIKEIDSGLPIPKRDHVKIVENDLELLKQAKAMLVIVDNNSSVGIYQEMVYAYVIFKKPVYLVILSDQKEHPWLNYHSTKIFNSLEEFEKNIVKENN